MVADTYSARLGMLEMGTGNQNNSWGTSFNASVTDVIDRAIAGVVTHAVTGGTLDHSGSPPPATMRQDIDAVHIFTGVLTSNQTYIVPNLSKTWKIFNNTSGAFQLFIKTTAGTAVQVPQGAIRDLWGDGANNIYRDDRNDVGKLAPAAYTAVKPGELACNGASLLRTDYPDLFTAIGTTWGAADGTHFTLPLFTDTGRFPRSSSGSLAVGTYQTGQNLAHTHTFSGALTVGTLVNDNPGNHTHANTLTDNQHFHTHPAQGYAQAGPDNGGVVGMSTNFYGGAGTPSNTNSASSNITITNVANGSHTHTITGVPGLGTLATVSNGGSELRPESAAVLYVIKF
jgi:microcystin-dependent protein